MEIESVLRVAIVAAGLIDAALLLWVMRAYRVALPGLAPNRGGTRLLLFGAAAMSLSFALGTLGVLLHVDSLFRLPVLLCAMVYVGAGCVLEIVTMRKRRR